MAGSFDARRVSKECFDEKCEKSAVPWVKLEVVEDEVARSGVSRYIRRSKLQEKIDLREKLVYFCILGLVLVGRGLVFYCERWLRAGVEGGTTETQCRRMVGVRREGPVINAIIPGFQVIFAKK